MNMFTISLRNLQRRPFRAILFSLVFIAGLTAVVGLHYASRDIAHSMEEKLARFGANIIIMPHENNHTISYGGVSLGTLSYEIQYLDEAHTFNAVTSIGHADKVVVIAPKLIEVASFGEMPVLLVGIDWDKDTFINPVWDLSYWDINPNAGAFLAMTEKNRNNVVYTAAGSDLGLQIGDRIEINGATLVIDHVFAQKGDETDKLVFTSLLNLQNLTDKPNQVNFIEVAAHCYACPIEEIVDQISANTTAQVKTMQSVVQQRIYTIKFVETIVWGIIVIILTASVLMMGLFMLSSVNERKKEIGIMRAVGYSKLSIFVAICTEAVILLFFSGTIGYIGGYFAGAKVLSMMEIEVIRSGLPIGDFVITVAAAVIMAVVASAFPAIKAARMNPAEALNRL